MRYLVRAEVALCEIADRSREERRAGLAGVWVTPSGAWASDGRVLLHVRRERAEALGAGRVFIPRDVARKVMQDVPSRGAYRKPDWPMAVVTCEDGHMWLRRGEVVVHEAAVDDAPKRPAEAVGVGAAKHARPAWEVTIPLEALERLVAYARRAFPDRGVYVALAGGFEGGDRRLVAVRFQGSLGWAERVDVEGVLLAEDAGRPGEFRPVVPVEAEGIGSYQWQLK